MRQYELVLIIKSDATESAQQKVLETVKNLVKELKVTQKLLGQKQLSYPIQKQTSGVFYLFSMEGETIPSDFEKKIFSLENVLRHLLIRLK